MTTSGIRVHIQEHIETLDKMTKSAMFFEGWANRRLLKLYANAQRQRWMTEGASESGKWRRLNFHYATEKKKRFAAYPGAGNAVLIATSRLLASVLPPEERKNEIPFGEEFRKIIQNKKIIFKTVTPYARDVDQARTFTTWSARTTKSFIKDFKTYLVAGIKGNI